jgi:biopolymer transport protein ExbD
MRFPRQARIFRGHLDPAPFVAVVFMLVLFLQISSFVHTPGVLVQLKNPAAIIHVDSDGVVRFGGASYKSTEMNQLLDALKNSSSGPPFDLRVAPGASSQITAQVSNVLQLFQINLPIGSTNQIIQTKNPRVIVAVNALGQYFFENQIMGEHDLTNALRKRVLAAAQNSNDLTLIVEADQRVNYDAVDHVNRWAAAAGVAEVADAERAVATAPTFGNTNSP